jgi:hypothetical protein
MKTRYLLFLFLILVALISTGCGAKAKPEREMPSLPTVAEPTQTPRIEVVKETVVVEVEKVVEKVVEIVVTATPVVTPTPDKIDLLSTVVAQLVEKQLTPQATATAFVVHTSIEEEVPTSKITILSVAPITTTLTLTSTVPLTSTAVLTVTNPISGFVSGWNIPWYRSPFTKTTSILTDVLTVETFAEPGVLPNNHPAWDKMSAEETPMLVPEAGYAYISVGSMDLIYKGATLVLPYKKLNDYLVVVRGLPSDGNSPSDLNQIITATNYVRAAGIYEYLPAGAYVSLDWTLDQIGNVFGKDVNCGASGCLKVTVVVVDLETVSYRAWEIANPKNLREWKRVN